MNSLASARLGVRLGGRAVLDALDLALRPGEITAVVGPNGAGKSTLLSCLAGLRVPNEGVVTLDGGLIGKLGDRERARRIGYLAQTPEIAWPLDVHTFVRLGRTAYRGVFGESLADAQAVERALERTGLCALAKRDVTSLSGGERALALIARALAAEPAWLLADEPLTGLDIRHQLDVADLLRRVVDAGVGVVVTIHDLGFAARCADRVVVLLRGRIIADGSAAQALTPAVLARAYGVDACWIDGRRRPVLDIDRITDL